MQGKNKPDVRRLEHAFILGSMDSTVANCYIGITIGGHNHIKVYLVARFEENQLSKFLSC